MSSPVNNLKIKILAVDDELEILDLFKDSLGELEFEILTATNVANALEIVNSEGPRLALIISDFSMHDQNGFDFRRQIPPDFKQVPFVIVSGQVTKEYALDAIDLGINGFLKKPFTLDELKETVKKLTKDRVAAILEDDELRDGFISDANQLTEEMEGLLLLLEENPTNVEALDRLFACAHTIKGTAGFFKPNTIHQFMHRFEDFLSPFKKGTDHFDAGAIQILLTGLDRLKALTRSLEAQKTVTESIEELTSIFEKRATVAASASTEPEKVVKVEVATKAVEELRVSIPVLNEFMEKSGEITVLRNMINKVFTALEVNHEGDPNVILLSELMGEMHKSISAMQDQISDLKKVSVGQVTRPLFRSLRDLCINLKKQIKLEVIGDNLRIDHGLSDVLNRCLIHLIRNSSDHGIEMPADRALAGKPESGTITLSFVETPEEIVIRLKDDGKGIDAQQVKRKAIEKGIITTEQAKLKSEAELRMLIFAAGFSTSEQVTDVSGRGVGTDMVKQVVTQAGGRIELNSTVGSGTEFIVRLPIPKSVLIVDSLLVKTGGNTYAIPQDSLDRIIDLGQNQVDENLKNVGSAWFYIFDGQLNPLIKLSDLLNGTKCSERPTAGYLVRLRSQASTVCLYVDDILGTEAIVVKAMASWFRQMKIYKGATFLGDGKIGLILDVDGIFEAHGLLVDSQKMTAEETIESLNSKQQYLIFTVDSRSVYALPQKDIFRIEKINTQDIHYSGNQPIHIFRGHAMPLVDLRCLLTGSSPAEQFDDLVLNLIIVRNGSSSFIGYVVEKIEDLTESLALEDASFYAGGNPVYVIGDRTISVLECETLNRRIMKPIRSARDAETAA
jgi:two-component system, chemotaxis family, sensor kinase CheA